MINDMTLREISEKTGFSIATVSRVLTHPEQVRIRTRNKVMAVINGKESFISKPKTGLIAFVVPDSTNIFFLQLLQGLEIIARMQDYSVIVCPSENNKTIEEKNLQKLLAISVEGIVYVGIGEISPTLKKIVVEQTVPIVFLDRDIGIENSTFVTADNVDGMYQSIKYLLSLGHKDILYMEGNSKLSTVKERRYGIEKAIAQQTADKIQVKYIQADFTMKTAYKEISKLLESEQFSATALCAANDMMALGAYQALREHGYRIPQDVSLIGYDNIPESAILNLTTVQQPYEEMGRTAMIALLSIIKNGEFLPQKNVLKTSLIVRNSCCYINSH